MHIISSSLLKVEGGGVNNNISNLSVYAISGTKDAVLLLVQLHGSWPESLSVARITRLGAQGLITIDVTWLLGKFDTHIRHWTVFIHVVNIGAIQVLRNLFFL